MTSPNNHLRGNHGSALVVTILLVSVMLTAALILLQRIIPYAKNVRGMNDAVQAYYTARGQVEAGRYGFFYQGGQSVALRMPTLFGLLSIEATTLRDNYQNTLSTRLQTSEEPLVAEGTKWEAKVDSPMLSTTNYRDVITIAQLPELPLKIKLFSTDSAPKYFGTSKRDPKYHTLNPNKSGGLRFDLRGVNTKSVDSFGLKLLFKDPTPALAKITIKMQYTSKLGDIVKTYTIDHDIATNSRSLEITKNDVNYGKTGNVQEIAPGGGVNALYDQKIEALLDLNCIDVKTCSLSLTLSGTDIPIDFQLVSTGATPAPLPDLNAVVIGDGLSDNGLYFQRVVDLIPTRQDI